MTTVTLKTLPSAINKLLKDASMHNKRIIARKVRRIPFRARRIADGMTPVDTGRLRQGHSEIMRASGSSYEVGLRNVVEYATAVHDGTGPHVIVPKRAKVLAFTVGGKKVFTKKVNHPGSKGTPFFTDPMNTVNDQVTAEIMNEISWP